MIRHLLLVSTALAMVGCAATATEPLVAPPP